MSINAAVTSSLASLQTAIANAGALQAAPQSTLAPIVSAVNAALAAIDAQAASIEATIDETSVGGIHVGTPAPQMAAILIAQSGGIADLSALQTMRGYVARIGANVENAPG